MLTPRVTCSEPVKDRSSSDTLQFRCSDDRDLRVSLKKFHWNEISSNLLVLVYSVITRNTIAIPRDLVYRHPYSQIHLFNPLPNGRQPKVKFALVQVPVVVVIAPPLPLCRWRSLIQKLKRRSQWYPAVPFSAYWALNHCKKFITQRSMSAQFVWSYVLKLT